ncbi:HrcA family transcriptional regulator [Helicobacter sp. MIT 03-1614]|uniref:Transcriptional regulator of heat shock genes HrcA n=1 Tax=Helicobacter hepaticus (strain ATCC 51449 / 3B1) TaxID=235279 RepID=Q7VIE1_HELHP|nr:MULTISPECIES: HrcA family transcriptional regulator [Helicobacter]AAP77262.1 transcriptional regulator of heat shock genes HrcA [Helicobacter hepaticus ATCC 51449]TLD89965.1 HrcA family transcriptional regulator [Helicobacter sp. MIT 03-1614]
MSKKDLLLSRVIVEYLKHKEPIGSESLKSLMNTKISSATIRNYFKALADEGLLFQPHVSSGRIPTLGALKSYWYKQLDTKSLVEVDSVKCIQEACFAAELFCAVSVEESNRLCNIQRLQDDKLLLEFERIGITLPFSSALERFLHELKGLEVIDVRKIAHQVRAQSLLDALSCVQSRNLTYFGVGAMAQAYIHNTNEQSFYSIIDGSMFDFLESGMYCEEVLPKGYMAIMQDIKLKTHPDKKTRMLCIGALDRDFAYFYGCIQS